MGLAWTYDHGDDHTSTLQQPAHTYGDYRSHVIQHIVTSMHGCVDSAHLPVTIDPDLLIHVPNAFTPDGDGINHAFLPSLVGFAVREYNLIIWNRWGELIFETNDESEAWDASLGGPLVQHGVYIWQIDLLAKALVGRKRLRGHVTLLR